MTTHPSAWIFSLEVHSLIVLGTPRFPLRLRAIPSRVPMPIKFCSSPPINRFDLHVAITQRAPFHTLWRILPFPLPVPALKGDLCGLHLPSELDRTA